MGCKPTLCLLFCEVVYLTGISNHWLLLCVQFWCCVIKITLVIQPPSSEITTWRVSAYWLGCQYFFNASCWPIKQHSISNYQPQLKYKQQPEALLAEWIKISLKCLDVSLCFARCEFDCGFTLTHANYWIISVDSFTNPSQSQFNHFEDAEPLFRHMVPHSPVHARSRANFIKRASQRTKFCTEARDSVLKPAHTIGGCRSSPEARSQRSPWFSRPAIAASPESHILSDSACFIDLIIRWFGAISPHQPLSAPISLRQKGRLQTMFAIQVSWGAMWHANNLKNYLALISRAWILNTCRLSNGPFLNLGATCFRTEWRARANFRRLLLRDSPSSQPPRLPKFNFGTASPTRCTNFSVLQKSDFCSTLVHWILRAFLS